jgi:hypothetical protein
MASAKFKVGDLATVKSGKVYRVERVHTHDEIRAFQMPGYVYVQGSRYEDNNKLISVVERAEPFYYTRQIKNGKPYGPSRVMNESALKALEAAK